tara:strand:+ start:703 stop:1263 length:561 start_codon:yes stop_codon:yes gene_type:complete
MLARIFLFFSLSILAGNVTADEASPRIIMETNLGSFELTLNAKRAPLTVKNFLELIDSRFYDGLIFHRVIDDFMIQAGGFDKNLRYYDSGRTVANESFNGLTNKTGAVAMARTEDPNSASSQFYINIKNNSSLNPKRRRPGYTVFGKVTSGWDVIKRIATAKTKYKNGISEALPLDPIIILRARRL